MRYVKCILIPDDELHPVDHQLVDDPSITRELLHNISLLDDGTAITLYQLSGEEGLIEDILDSSSEVLAYQLSGADDAVHAYIHFQANHTTERLLMMLQEFEFIIDTPLEYTRRGGLRVTLIGDWETFREAIPAVPEEIRLKLEETGTYEPDTDRLFSQLTARQQETLEVAVDMGYYTVPRQATHEDIAAELDRTGGTVGGHLRKIEAKILSQIVP